MGFVDYFLIVCDFIGYAKAQRHPRRAGARQRCRQRRVPTASASRTWTPMKYNLYFERFLNPERVSMPDIDVDFCDAAARRR